MTEWSRMVPPEIVLRRKQMLQAMERDAALGILSFKRQAADYWKERFGFTMVGLNPVEQQETFDEEIKLAIAGGYTPEDYAEAVATAAGVSND